MRFKDGSKAQKKGADEKDSLETSYLRGVQNELQDREQKELWQMIPDAKLQPRKSSNDDHMFQLLKSYGLASLDDLVAHNDIIAMRFPTNEELPGERDRARHAKLHATLRDLHAKPDIKSSYQYLAGANTVIDGQDGTWQVAMSRRRRQRSERMSRDHHDKKSHEVEGPDMETLRDAHGNEILPMIEGTTRVATMKEMKRIRRQTAARRRAGEEVFTDDELEAAKLEMPPEGSFKSKPTLRRAVNLEAYGPTGGIAGLVDDELAQLSPTADEMREWKNNMYLEPPGCDRSSDRSSSGHDVYSSVDSNGSWMLVGNRSTVVRVDSISSC